MATTTARSKASSPRLRVRGSGAQTVYDALRQSIVDLTLEPGSGLDEVKLAERFSMSRTPVREALVRLAAEGLVTALPNRNTIVSHIDFVRLPVYFEALALMHRVTARLAAGRRTPRDLLVIRASQAAFADAAERRDAIAMISTNRDFHVAIAEAGGNPHFTGLFTRLLDEGRRILRLYYQSFGDKLPRQYVDEHEAIVAAIDAGDAELCDRLAAMHAGQIVQQIQTYIATDLTTEISLSEDTRSARQESAVHR